MTSKGSDKEMRVSERAAAQMELSFGQLPGRGQLSGCVLPFLPSRVGLASGRCNMQLKKLLLRDQTWCLLGQMCKYPLISRKQKITATQQGETKGQSKTKQELSVGAAWYHTG